jgi:hypothetical protein
VTHGPEIPDDAAVLCFEGTYLDEATTRRIRSRAPLGCFVTEIIGDGKFYDGMGHWDGRIRWQKFLEQARTFDFIWTSVPQDLEILGRYAPARFIEFGYSPVVQVPDDVEPDIDFSFFGKRNAYRDKILNDLARYFRVVAPDDMVEVSARDQIGRRTKFNIVLKQSPDWPLPSPTRLASLLHLERAIVRDRASYETQQSRTVPMVAEGQDFIDYCADALKQDWRSFRGASIDAFKRLTMKDIMGGAIRETLSPGSAQRGA